MAVRLPCYHGAVERSLRLGAVIAVVLVALIGGAALVQRMTAQPIMGPNAFDYFEKRTTMDVSADYQVNRRIALFVSGRNVFNKTFNVLRYEADTPGYAKRSSTREYGVQWSFGLKGTF